MSEIQNDADVVGKRKNTLNVKEPLRDQLVNKLHDKLEDMEIASKVNHLWDTAMSDRTEWLARQEEYLTEYDEFLDIEPQGLFETSSNLHVPMTLWVSRTYHARFLQTLLTPEPSVAVKARKSIYQDVEQDIEDFLKYTLTEWCNHHRGIEEALDVWVWQWITTGIGYLKHRWDKKYQRYTDVIEVEVEGPTKFVVDPETGGEVQVPSKTIKEVESEVVKTIFDGPVISPVNIEDIVVIGPDITDIDGSDGVIERHFMTASQMWTLADRGVFNADAVGEVIEGGDVSQSATQGGNIKQQRVQTSGEGSLDKIHDHDRYQILEAYLSLDVDGSGINTDVIVWVDTKAKVLLRATYLHRVSKAGKRPFSVAVFHKRSGQNNHMPVGLVEMLYNIQKELDAIHNMRIDFGLISSMPFGFYRASSSIDPQSIRIEPGSLIPVDNPGDVVFPNLGNRTIFGMQEEAQLYTMVERLTGISDLSLGSMSGKQGATRTATGTRALVAESNTNLDVPLKRLNRGWKRTLECLLDMLQERTPEGMEYRVPGGEGFDLFMQITGKHDLAGDYAIEVSPISSASNPQVRVENASQILQMTMNPLNLQTGVVTPQNMYEANKHYLKAIGIKDYSRFLNAGYENQVTLIPAEEMNRVLAMQNPAVVPNSDHESFVALADSYLKDDARLGELTEGQALAIQAQRQKHIQMAQAMQQAQAQAANVQQQITNSQQAAQGQSSNPAAPVNPGTEG